MFEIVSSTNNLFRYYRTPTAFTSDRLCPQIKLIKEVPYLLVPTENSYYVYRLENLQLHFMGPRVERLSGVHFNEYEVLMCADDAIHRADRGEIVSTCKLNGTVEDLVKFGGYIVVRLNDTEIVVFDQISDDKQSTLPIDAGIGGFSGPNTAGRLWTTAREDEVPDFEDGWGGCAGPGGATDFIKEVYRFTVSEKVAKLYHPHAYSNKILIIYETGRVDIYNIHTRKMIFSLSLGRKIASVGQTSVLDVLGFVLEDGTVRIFNIKKNRLVFEITSYRTGCRTDKMDGGVVDSAGGGNGDSRACIGAGGPRHHVDFKGRFALIIVDGNLMIYDLELRRELFKKHGVLYGLLVSEGAFLFTTAESIELYDMDGFTLLKRRSMISGMISGIEAAGSKEVLLVGPNRLFRMNIYKDEQNIFMRNKKDIGLISVGENILTYGEGRLDYYDAEGSSHRFIDRKCDWIKTFGQFCFLGSGRRCLVMNLKSRRIVVDYRLDGPDENVVIDGDLNNERFVILTNKAVRLFNYKKEELFVRSLAALSHPGDGGMPLSSTAAAFRRVRMRNNLYFIQGKSELVVLCDAEFRRFVLDKYEIDSTGKYLAAVSDGVFRLYDLLSGNLIDEMKGNVAFRDVVILDGLKFVGLLDVGSDFHLFYNHSFFRRSDSSFLATRRGSLSLDIRLEKKESNFYKEMAMYRTFGTASDDLIRGLGKEEVASLLKIIESNLDDPAATQTVLSRLLQYKSHLIEPTEIEKIFMHIEQERKMGEDRLLKTLAYLRVTGNDVV